MPLVEDLVDVAIRPTLFSHHAHLDADVYPEDVADVAGYCADDCILGGVAVFDRRREGLTTLQVPNHSWRISITIFRKGSCSARL